MTTLIETNIPVPDQAQRGGRQRQPEYIALQSLEKDQSVFIPNKKLETVRIYLSSPPMKVLKDKGQKYFAAAAEKLGVAGVRVWRTE